MNKLAGKVAVVTGAGFGGIGFGIAETFLSEGASVVISDIAEAKLTDALATLRKVGNVAGCLADVSKRADAERTVQTAIRQFRSLDILVNNAAASTPGIMIQDLSDDAIQLNLGSSLYGTLYHMQAAFPHLQERGGSIINFGSRNAILGASGFALYAAAKEGVRGLTRTAAREWGRYKIRANVICPAALSPGARAFLDANPEEAKSSLADTALGYFGDPRDDIGPVALFLASDDSRYVTGQTINADGGQVML